MIITNDDNLWSCGRNDYGQLCHGDQEDHLKPQKTSFSAISKISAGFYHSLFQNSKGEIFSCGNNQKGQCGLGSYNYSEITPSLILNLPSNLVHFVCGSDQSLFLDSEGNVFSVGSNEFGELGLNHNTNQNELNNQQISYGSCGYHFLAKNSQNQIFVTGYNDFGQLGTEDTESVLIPKEINSQYSSIWRDEFRTRAKSARKKFVYSNNPTGFVFGLFLDLMNQIPKYEIILTIKYYFPSVPFGIFFVCHL